MAIPYERATSGRDAIDQIRQTLQAFGCTKYAPMEDFAGGQALSGFMMAKTVYWDDAATMAYKAADAMLAARGAK